MFFRVEEMTIEAAAFICTWDYGEEFAFYNIEASSETLAELLDGSFFAVYPNFGPPKEHQELVGYICFGKSARVPTDNAHGIYFTEDYLDVGLGLRPDYCGKGYGIELMKTVERTAKQKFGANKLRLAVASFNERAKKVYKRAGFQPVCSFDSMLAGRVNFTVMIKEID